MKKLILYVIGCLVLVGCGPMSPEDYVAWVKAEENGLHKIKETGDYKLDVQFKPSGYMLLQEMDGKVPSDTTFKRYTEEMKGEAYFDLKLGPKGSSVDLLRHNVASQMDYQERVYFFSFKFTDFIYLKQGDRKIPCSAYHFERAYNLKNNRSFLLGFSDVNFKEPVTLVIDVDILKTGPTEFEFDLQNMPVLETLSE